MHWHGIDRVEQERERRLAFSSLKSLRSAGSLQVSCIHSPTPPTLKVECRAESKQLFFPPKVKRYCVGLPLFIDRMAVLSSFMAHKVGRFPEMDEFDVPPFLHRSDGHFHRRRYDIPFILSEGTGICSKWVF